jgi:multidrug efflux system membrane fusion protein
VNEGNLIKANADNAMVVINQIQPIYVNFSVPERYLSEIKKYMSQQTVKVEAHVSGESQPVWGVLTFIDNTVDQSTGTIRMKGTFDNKERRLWPGQFVDVVLTLSTIPKAVVIPSQAVQAGQQGQFVFVIGADSTAEARPVATGVTFEGETVIEKGLQVGEQVVTDGQMRLMPGAKVDVKSPPSGKEGKAL